MFMMIATIFSLFAAVAAALSNLFFRKNALTSSITSPSGYLVLFYFFSFISSFIFFPEIWHSQINYTLLVVGGFVGVLNIVLMDLTSRALHKGPAGLTFAFQNASAVFPGFLLFLSFGSSYGFSCSLLQIGGMALVLFGLFLGAKEGEGSHTSWKWLKYAISCFIIQTIALTCIQGRCILFDSEKLHGFLSSFALDQTDDMWFMPGQFGTAFILQFVLFLREKRALLKSELTYGCLGGIANFASTALLLMATKYALDMEKGILFPTFAVATIILCNTWAALLYKETFKVKSNVLCAIGIFMGIIP
jgi:hypothetical protein